MAKFECFNIRVVSSATFSFICDIFQMSQQPRRFSKNKAHQNFLFVNGYFFEEEVAGMHSSALNYCKYTL